MLNSRSTEAQKHRSTEAQKHRSTEAKSARFSSQPRPNRLKRYLGLAVLAAFSMLLAGCPQKVEEIGKSIPVWVGVHCNLGPLLILSECHPKGRIGLPPGPGGANFLAALTGAGTPIQSLVSSGPLTADDIYIDTAGTSVSVPANGTVTLSVFNASGQLIGAQAFAWAKSGTKIKLQNPSSVQAWYEGYASSATRLEYTLSSIDVPLNGQLVTLENHLVMSQEDIASTSYTFVANRPRGGPASPQQPHL